MERLTIDRLTFKSFAGAPRGRARPRAPRCIVISAGTCGQASGANDLIRIAKRELLDRGLTEQRPAAHHRVPRLLRDGALGARRAAAAPSTRRSSPSDMARIVEAVANGRRCSRTCSTAIPQTGKHDRTPGGHPLLQEADPDHPRPQREGRSDPHLQLHRERRLRGAGQGAGARRSRRGSSRRSRPRGCAAAAAPASPPA